MLRVGLDIRYIYDHFPGIGRYVVNLAQALAALTPRPTLVLLHNPALLNTRYDLAPLASLPGVELVTTSARPFSLAEQVQVPRLTRALRLDLLHSPYYIKPYAGLSCPSVVTIYDLIGRRHPETLSRRGRVLQMAALSLAVRSAAHIITISQSSCQDILRYYRVPAGRVSVIPCAADPHFAPQPAARIAAVRAHYRLPPRYLLYLGSNKPHKNLISLVHAWGQVVGDQAADQTDDQAPHLVIAGHHDPRYPEAEELAQARGLTDSILFRHNVADTDMPALYSGAEAFVFPSYYEGFGLPPLEAMACGTPVLCASASSLPEVVGTAALLFDPMRVEEIADGIRRLLQDGALRAQLRAAGLQRASLFSWERAARETLTVYEAVSARSRAG